MVRKLSPDNRATAVADGCESKTKCRSAEAANLLDSISIYEESGSEPGTELLDTVGPQHTVRLAGGTQVEAREHTVNSYDKGAPSEGGPYDLVTKTTDGALLSSGEEKDVRTTKISYTGAENQANLGWKLRKPTAVTTDPGGLNLTHMTVYEPSTGQVVETTTPKGTEARELESKVPTYSSSFGSLGEGAGELLEPTDLKVDASGNVWVADEPDSRVEEFNAKGEFVREVGSAGSGGGQLSMPYGLAFDSKGNVWVSDTGNERIEEFTSEGVFVKAIGWGVSNGESKLEVCTSSCQAGIQGSGNGQFFYPEGLSVNAAGDLFVADRGNKRIQELTAEGAYVKSITAPGEPQGPSDVVLDSAGDLWSTYNTQSDSERIVEFSPEGSVIKSFGTHGSAPEISMPPSDWPSARKATSGWRNGGTTAYRCSRQPANTCMASEPPGKGRDSSITPGASASTGRPCTCSTAASRTPGPGIPAWRGGRCRASYGVKKMPTTRRRSTTAQKAKPKSKPVATTPNGRTCRARPSPPNSRKPAGCRTSPSRQTTYNIWDEPETTTETVGATTRTKTETYDAAGRLKTSAVSSTVGTALPTVTDEYNEKTGALEKQCTNEGKPCTEGKPKTITSVYNTLGQLTSYTDADEDTTTYEYEGEGGYKGEKELEGRLRHVNDGKGTETYTYNETTGLLDRTAQRIRHDQTGVHGDV